MNAIATFRRWTTPRPLMLTVAALCALVLACTDRAESAARSTPPTPTPDSFRVTFETSRGTFVVQVNRALAPNGADRFHQLVEQHFFDQARFFRVVPGFVAQFGLSADPKGNSSWDSRPILDDSVRTSNTHGTLSFASM